MVCQRVGGIVEQEDGLYECQNCGTPYRPRSSAKKSVSTLKAKETSSTQETDRFVWFSFRGKDGTIRHGFYDFPLGQPTEASLDTDKLNFLRYLYQTGRLTE